MSTVDQRHHDRLIDYIKQLTTLSTGSIVLQVAFLEKLFPHPKWKALIVTSLACLAVSLIASVALHTMLLADPGEMEEGETIIFTALLVAVWAGFLIGILALGVFGARNLLSL